MEEIQNENLFEFETLEDYGVDALGAAGTGSSNNSSNGTSTPVIVVDGTISQ